MLNVNAAADRNWIKIHNLCNSAQELLGYYLFNRGFMSYSDISLIEHAKCLYPINGSLTGDGTRQTLQYFEGFFPNFERLKYKSGEEVMDWVIPQEWNVRDAYVEHIESGRRYAEFKKLNLHLLGYSEPV